MWLETSSVRLVKVWRTTHVFCSAEQPQARHEAPIWSVAGSGEDDLQGIWPIDLIIPTQSNDRLRMRWNTPNLAMTSPEA